MDIKDVKEKKRILQDKILDLLIKFEEQTDTVVGDILIHRVYVPTPSGGIESINPNGLVDVTVEIEV